MKSKRLLERVIKKSVVKIELGSGSKKGKNGWITIDLYGADINMDLRRRLPIPNFSVDKFFASHFLEHLNIMELHNILTTDFFITLLSSLFDFIFWIPKKKRIASRFFFKRFLLLKISSLFKIVMN